VDPRPACLITGTVSPYRREPFRLLAAAQDVEVLAFEDTGPPVPGLTARPVTQAGAVRAVLSGRYRAVICGTGGRVALPGSYAAARLRGIPFVLWATIWAHPRTPAHRLSWLPTRHLYRHADAVATYGGHVSRYVARHRRDESSIVVAPQAVDVEHFAAPVPDEAVAAARQRAGVEPGGFLALFVGRLEQEKGIDTLLAAWREADLGPGAGLAFAGRGPMREEIARAGGAVRSLDYLDALDLPALYAAADTLVLPSVPTATFREPWGLVVNEAMLQRTPVIASDAVGAAAGGLVVPGSTGMVFPAGDASALAACLSQMAGDPAARARMGDSALRAASRLDPAAWAAGMGSAMAAAGAARWTL
jgi:glycosyltransferase involved in cell wall biosynthesis